MRQGESIRRLCPAKVNLYLRIVGGRPDGYHELVTVMQPLSLADELTLTVTSGGINLSCDRADLPQDGDNIVWQAAEKFIDEIGLALGIQIFLRKRIPIAAGLGGGSSDAAGTLLVLNQMTGQPLGEAALHRLGRELGADVPFFLRPGPQVGRGIGTDLSPITLPPYWYVLINPDIPISTRWVYENLDLPALNKSKKAVKETWDGENPGGWVANDLETVTLSHYPVLRDFLQALARLGAQAQGMSGSGPTLFGIFPERANAEAAAREVRKTFGGWLAVVQGLTGTSSEHGWENQVWMI